MLVERKARKFILQQGQLDKATLDQAVGNMSVIVVKYKV